MWIKLLLQFDVAIDIYLEVNKGQVTPTSRNRFRPIPSFLNNW